MNTMICFEKPTFYMYLFILFAIMSFLIFYKIKEQFSSVDLYKDASTPDLYNKLLALKDELYQTKLSDQKCKIDLQQSQNYIQQVESSGSRALLLNKVYNPLSGTSTVYSGKTFNTPGYNAYQTYQMIGYLSGGVGEQYPVMGRWHNSNRSDKWEYYTINESRGRIKIPFKTSNYNELYDGDSVNIPELGGDLKFKKYEDTDSFRYNSEVF